MIPVDRDKDFIPAIKDLENKITLKTEEILISIDGLSKKLEEILKRMNELNPVTMAQPIKTAKPK